MGISEIAEFTSKLSTEEAIMARLVVTIAQSPMKVSSRLTKKFVNIFSDNFGSERLIGACSYAAFVASKRIASFWNYHEEENSTTDNSSSILKESNRRGKDNIPPIEVLALPHSYLLTIFSYSTNTKISWKALKRNSFLVKLNYPSSLSTAVYSSFPHGNVEFQIRFPREFTIQEVKKERNKNTIELEFFMEGYSNSK